MRHERGGVRVRRRWRDVLRHAAREERERSGQRMGGGKVPRHLGPAIEAVRLVPGRPARQMLQYLLNS